MTIDLTNGQWMLIESLLQSHRNRLGGPSQTPEANKILAKVSAALDAPKAPRS